MTTYKYKLVALDNCAETANKFFGFCGEADRMAAMPTTATEAIFTAWLKQLSYVTHMLSRINSDLLVRDAALGRTDTNRDLNLLDRRILYGHKHVVAACLNCADINLPEVRGFVERVLTVDAALFESAKRVRLAVDAYWEGA